MSVDTSELDQLARDLAGAPRRVAGPARRVAKRSALEVKRGMQADFSGHRYAGQVPGSLEFEAASGDGLAWRVGELDSGGPQWGLAAILAYGTSNNSPVVDHTAALTRELPQVQHHLGDAGASSLLGGAR